MNQKLINIQVLDGYFNPTSMQVIDFCIEQQASDFQPFKKDDCLISIQLQDNYFGYTYTRVITRMPCQYQCECKLSQLQAQLQEYYVLIVTRTNISDLKAQFLQKSYVSKKIRQLGGSSSKRGKERNIKDQLAISSGTQLLQLVSEVRGSSSLNFENQYHLNSQIIKQVFQENKYSALVIKTNYGQNYNTFIQQLQQQLSIQQNQKVFESLSFKADKKNQCLLNQINSYKNSQNQKSNEVNNRNTILLLEEFDIVVNKNYIDILEKISFKNSTTKIIATTFQYNSLPDFRLAYCLGLSQDKIFTSYLCPIDKNYIQNQIISVQNFFKTIHISQHVDLEIFQKPFIYQTMFENIESLSNMIKNPLTVMIVLSILPQVYALYREQFIKNNKQIARIQIYQIFCDILAQHQLSSMGKNDLDVLLNQQLDSSQQVPYDQIFEQIRPEYELFHQIVSWRMLAYSKKKADTQVLKNVFQQAEMIFKINLSIKKAKILTFLAPTIYKDFDEIQENISEFAYFDEQLQYFYIAQSILKERVLQCNGAQIQSKYLILHSAYLFEKPDIIQFVVEQVSLYTLEKQQTDYFLPWYKLALLSREQNCNQSGVERKLNQSVLKLASNCVNLLASFSQCDLTDKDFSNCYLKNVNLCRKDLSNSNFSNCVLENCDFSDSQIDNCLFVKCQFKNLECKATFTAMQIHESDVNQVVFGTCERLIASASDDNTIIIWDVEQRQDKISLRAGEYEIKSLAISPDGKLLASGSLSQAIVIWAIAQKRKIFSLQSNAKTTFALAFSANSNLLASGHSDYSIILWDLYLKSKIVVLTGHKLTISSLQFSPDCKTLVSTSCDRQIYFWDTETANRIGIAVEPHLTQAFAMSPDGSMFATGGYDFLVRIWEIESKTVTANLSGHSQKVMGVAFSADCVLLASGSHDNTVKLWEVQSRHEIITLNQSYWPINCVAFSPDSKTIVSGGKDQTVRFWNLPNILKIAQYKKGHTSAVNALAISSDSKILASASSDCNIKLWDLQSASQITTLRGHLKGVCSIAFSPDDKQIASGSIDCTVILWNTYSKSKALTLQGHLSTVYAVKISPNGQLLASGSGDRKIMVWPLHGVAQRFQLQGHKMTVLSVAFAMNSQLLASASYDDTVKLWNLNSQSEIATFNQHSDMVQSVSFSPDARFLASGCSDNNIGIVVLENRDQEMQIYKHGNFQVISVAFSPDSKLLASCDSGGSIVVWDMQNFQKLADFEAHSEKVNCVLFSNDGNFIVSCSQDCTIKVWALKYILSNEEDPHQLDDQRDTQTLFTGAKEFFEISVKLTGSTFNDCDFTDASNQSDLQIQKN